MRKTLLSLLLLTVPLFVCAQYKANAKRKHAFSKKRNKPRNEYIIGFGGSNFLGELGGANQIGTHFVKDMEFVATRPSIALGLRYRPSPRWAFSGGLHYLMLSGADRLTTEPYRQNRNLSFRSPIIELSAQAEFFLTKEQMGRAYNIRNVKKGASTDIQAYVFVGVGGFFFNPQAKYNGSWVNLQPLGTEGQGLPGGSKKYSRIGVCIPYGLGAKYNITKEWAVGIEFGIRKTFTDYIDDVSTVYYDNDALKAAHGEKGAYLADPSLLNYPESLGGDATGAQQTAAGQQRGDPKAKDAYMFTNVTISYRVPYRRRTRSKF
ncbi:MAG TPA: DUF6089 family protein [Bacteroidia bacterium]|jgi:hypothetical protein|nr:DUF6089 family protein [Bacteroidia bacterium]